MNLKGAASMLLILMALTLLAYRPYKSALDTPTNAEAQETDSLQSQIELYINSQVANGFKGNVLVVKEGTPIINTSYGQKENSPDITYWIASNTKPVMALAILKLQAMGKIAVEDRITRYFTVVPDDKKHITIHQLLSHSSGLPQQYSMDGVKTFDQALAAVMKVPVNKEKIGQYEYSNDGYNLLALLLEKVTGTTYEAFVSEQVLKPAQTTATGFWGFEKESNIPLAPLFNPKRLTKKMTAVYAESSVANYGYKGATGMYSTAADQYKLYKAMTDGSVLPKINGQKAFEPHVLVRETNGTKTYYGYGWVNSFKDNQITNIRHSGDEEWLGHNSLRLFYPNGDAIIVLSNAHVNKEGDLWAVKVGYGLQGLLRTKQQ